VPIDMDFFAPTTSGFNVQVALPPVGSSRLVKNVSLQIAGLTNRGSMMILSPWGPDAGRQLTLFSFESPNPAPDSVQVTVSVDGASTSFTLPLPWRGLVSVAPTVSARPTTWAIVPYGNPSGRAVSLSCEVPHQGACRVVVFDATGRRV